MPPVEKPLIIGRKAIMAFLQITNWDSVLRLRREGDLPIGKPDGGGRWVGKRINLQAWLDRTTGGSKFKDEPVNICQKLQSLTPKNAVDFTQVWNKWRTPKMERFLVAYRNSDCMVSPACRAAKISRETYYQWRRNYERFDEACNQINIEVHGHAATQEKAA